MPVELELSSLRTTVKHGLGDSDLVATWLHLLKKMDENRRCALQNYEALQKRRKLHHDAQKKTVKFNPGELVLMVDHWLVKQHGQKFRPKWLGPFVVHQRFDNGSYSLSIPEGEILKK